MHNYKDFEVNIISEERIETEHLILRKARPEDIKARWKNVWSDEEVAKYMLWIPTKTEEEARERMERTIFYQGKIPAFFVCLKESDEPIGFAGIKEVEEGVYEDCGACFMRTCQRKGYGKEMIAALTTLAFEKFHAKAVRFGCFEENIPSKSLIECMGFEFVDKVPEVREKDGYEYIALNYIMYNPDHDKNNLT